MAVSVTLNSVNINSGHFKLTRLLHDSSPVLDINSLDINRRDGSTLISTNYRPKEITIDGWITGDSQADLELNIDDFKKTSVLSNINLDVSYGSGGRRYVVTATGFSITRESYDITRVRYSLKLICLTPFAIGTAEVEALSVVNITSNLYETTMTVDGTAKPQPTINYTIDSAGNLGIVRFNNTTTEKQIEIGTAFGSGDLLSINCENRTVQLNNIDVEFEGVFPEFEIGINNIKTYITTNNVSPNQSQYTNITTYPNKYVAQSFSATATGNINSIEIMMGQLSGVYDSLKFYLYSDSGGNPNVSLREFTASPSLSSNPQWITLTPTSAISITSGTTYWIVIVGQVLRP